MSSPGRKRIKITHENKENIYKNKNKRANKMYLSFLQPYMEFLYIAQLFNSVYVGDAAANSLFTSLMKAEAQVLLQEETRKHVHTIGFYLFIYFLTIKSLLVVFAIADSTTTGFSSGKLSMRLATSFILSADATDEPPNFITQVNFVSVLFSLKVSVSFLSSSSALLASQVTLRALFLPQEWFMSLVNAGARRFSPFEPNSMLFELKASPEVLTPHKCIEAAITQNKF